MVEILLASYNGEKYIAEQLESLIAQTEKDISVLIRDDGSTDATLDIIRRYSAAYPEMIRLIEDEVRCGDPARNFMQLMTYSTADYTMFCDQDDFWFPEKVERTLAAMRRAEEEQGKERPVVVFSDYVVADKDLVPLPVKEENLQVAAAHTELSRLLVQNYITGCTMMLNRKAVEMAGKYDERILMHDWWVGLYASACGTIVHLPVRLMYYRQHGSNDVGAKDVKSFRYRISRLLDPGIRDSMQNYYRQAELLEERFGSCLPADAGRTLRVFLALPGLPRHRRIAALVRGGYLKSDLVRIIGELVFA